MLKFAVTLFALLAGISSVAEARNCVLLAGIQRMGSHATVSCDKIHPYSVKGDLGLATPKDLLTTLPEFQNLVSITHKVKLINCNQAETETPEGRQFISVTCYFAD